MGILEQSIQALKVLTPALGMIPAIGDNLKGAAELASEICELVKVRGILWLYTSFQRTCLV
jgi:hypothetical protein